MVAYANLTPLTGNPDGWHYIGHPSSGKRLRMAYNNSTLTATYGMDSGSSTSADVQWRFIVPPPSPTWSGAAGSSWVDAPNWMPGLVPASGDSILFNATSVANLATMLDQNFSLSGIRVDNPAGSVSIGGSQTLTLGDGGIDLSSAKQNLTVATPIVLGAAQSWTAGEGRLLHLNGPISGAFAATVNGPGIVSIGAPLHPQVSVTVASGGRLRLSGPGVLANGDNVATPTINGTLDLNGTTQLVNAIAGSGNIDNTSAAAAQLTIGGNNAAFVLGTQFHDTGGDLSVIKTGSGNLTLSQASTFSGGFTNNGTGNILPQHSNGFGTGPVVMNGGQIYPNAASYTFANALTLNAAVLRIGGGSNRTITWTGPVSITGASSLQADNGASGITVSGGITINGGTLNSAPNGTTNTISAPITGTGTVAASGFATGTLNLTAANSFSGNFRAILGTLRIGHANALQNGTLDMNAADSGSVNLNNLNAIIGALTGSRNLPLGSAAISIGNNHASTTYSGVLSGSGSLVKVGGGKLTLSGVNTYTGGTALQAGTLALGVANALPSSDISIGNATLDAATFIDSLGTLDATASGASLNFGSGGALSFASSSDIDWSGGDGRLTITGVFVSGVSLRFGTNASGLTAAQLARISIPGYTSLALNSAGYLTAVPIETYDTWKTRITNGLDGRLQDADGDGVSNLDEFLFGTSPMSGAGTLLATSLANGGLTLRWLQLEGGATYLLKENTELSTGAWTNVLAPLPALDLDQSAVPVGYDRFTVTLPTTNPRRFLRVEATEN